MSTDPTDPTTDPETIRHDVHGESMAPVTSALVLLHLGAPTAAERVLATMTPEALTRWAATADALNQACLALARRVAPSGLDPAEVADARAEHEKVHPEVYGLKPAGPVVGPTVPPLTDVWIMDDFD